MKLDSGDKYQSIIKMIHYSLKEKEFIQIRKFDWTGKDDFNWVLAEFYKSDELERDGFIHPDGSLRFEFEIIKKNYRK